MFFDCIKKWILHAGLTPKNLTPRRKKTHVERVATTAEALEARLVLTDVSMQFNPDTVGAGQTMTVSINFNEVPPDSAFTVEDINAPNGVLSDLTTSDGLNWTAVFTPNEDVEDYENVMVLDLEVAWDGDIGPGQGGTVQSSNYVVDTKLPTADIALSDGTLYLGDTSTVTITFSEPVTDLTASDFTVQNGTISEPSTSDGGTTWTATLTPNANTNSAFNTMTLQLSGVTDAAGNAGTGTATETYLIKTTRPTATITVVHFQ